MSGLTTVQLSTIQQGHLGVQSGMRRAEEAARDIVKVGTTEIESSSSLNDLAEASVDLLEAKNQVQASAKVVQAGDEMLGTVINTIA